MKKILLLMLFISVNVQSSENVTAKENLERLISEGLTYYDALDDLYYKSDEFLEVKELENVGLIGRCFNKVEPNVPLASVFTAKYLKESENDFGPITSDVNALKVSAIFDSTVKPSFFDDMPSEKLSKYIEKRNFWSKGLKLEKFYSSSFLVAEFSRGYVSGFYYLKKYKDYYISKMYEALDYSSDSYCYYFKKKNLSK